MLWRRLEDEGSGSHARQQVFDVRVYCCGIEICGAGIGVVVAGEVHVKWSV